MEGDSEIDGLLRQLQSGSETVQDLAWTLLQRFRKECIVTVALYGPGAEPHVEKARRRLKERLRALLDWGKTTGKV